MSWRDYASAPCPGRLICARHEVSGAIARIVETPNGRFPVLLVETTAGLRAYVDACPHQYLPLGHRGGALLSADGRRLLCSSHGAQFDAVTGEGVAGEGLGCSLEPIPLREEDGRLFIGEA